MNSTTIATDQQAAILGRSILPDENEITDAQARFLADLHFNQRDIERMNELAAVARDGALGVEEQRELDDYRHVGNVLETIKSRARLKLRQRSEPV